MPLPVSKDWDVNNMVVCTRCEKDVSTGYYGVSDSTVCTDCIEAVELDQVMVEYGVSAPSNPLWKMLKRSLGKKVSVDGHDLYYIMDGLERGYMIGLSTCPACRNVLSSNGNSLLFCKRCQPDLERI